MDIKKIEKFAIILIILWVLQKPISYLISMVYFNVSFLEEVKHMWAWNILSSYAGMLITELLNIFIGIWLYCIAKKENQGIPWFWLMLGIFTGVLAALLYFVLRIYQSLKSENELPTEPSSYSSSLMKKVEIAAIVILPFWLLYFLFWPIFEMVYWWLSSSESLQELRQSTSNNLWLSYGYSIIKQAFSILIGIWLFVITKKEKQGTPWFWLLLGIFGGVFAPLLYFILRVYQCVKPEAITTANHLKTE
jgi:uncharacterized membrane protein